ncbi:MAG: YrdB family protein [Chloroflexi bacterium]|nr:YrdB family protein [Chloroflexota bacterium]
MDALKMLNLAVRFLLELCLLAAVGYWGFKTQSSWLWKFVLGLGLPLLIAILWGTFLAPRAGHRLQGFPYYALELTLFATGALALFAADRPALGWVYSIVLVINTLLLAVWKQ